MKRANLIKAALIISLTISSTAGAYEPAIFYRASNIFSEPRLANDWLSTFEISLEGGSTKHARDRDDQTVPLFDIYGISNLHALSLNVPGKDSKNPLDLLLVDMSLSPKSGNFGYVSVHGNFSLLQSTILLTQNFVKGFFLQAYLPIRRLSVDELCYADQSLQCSCPGKSSPLWEVYLKSFDLILANYQLSRSKTKETGVGDLCILAGWSLNYDQTKVLDYVDCSAQVGLLFPTGKKQNIDKVFSLPLGYNKHWGFPIVADISFGVYEWLTIGMHIDALVFVNKCRTIRVKTAPSQQGIFKLAKLTTSINQGAIWSLGAFVKADHFCRGISFMGGYTFNKQDRSTINGCDACPYSLCVMNSDEALWGWKMHTIHVGFEIDFTCENAIAGPRLNIFYNRQVGGKYVFKTDITTARFTCDIVWDF